MLPVGKAPDSTSWAGTRAEAAAPVGAAGGRSLEPLQGCLGVGRGGTEEGGKEEGKRRVKKMARGEMKTGRVAE